MQAAQSVGSGKLPTIKRCVARSGISSEKIFFNLSAGKAKLKR
jgi:hypothetical protein